MPASPKEQEKRKKFKLDSIHVYTSEPYEENVVKSWVGETTDSVTIGVKTQKGVRQAKKPTKRNPAAGQKDHFK